jgi:uncharacterized protein
MTLEELREYRPEILKAAATYGIDQLRVFGSVARGEDHPESDVDFLVRLDRDRSLFDLGGFYMDLKDLLGTKVSLVTENSLHRLIRSQVLSEAVDL